MSETVATASPAQTTGGSQDAAPATATATAAAAAPTPAETLGKEPGAAEQQPATTDGKPADGDKPAAATESKADEKPAGAPEKYEFKAPEGQKLDPAVIEEFSAVAKELNLSQEAAQKVVDKLAPKMLAAQAEQFNAVNEGWINSAKTDKEFGGEKFDSNLAIAKKALDAFGTPELRQLLVTSGLGNNPEMIRAFYRAGKAISQDTAIPGGTRPTGTPANDAAARLYGTSTK